MSLVTLSHKGANLVVICIHYSCENRSLQYKYNTAIQHWLKFINERKLSSTRIFSSNCASIVSLNILLTRCLQKIFDYFIQTHSSCSLVLCENK